MLWQAGVAGLVQSALREVATPWLDRVAPKPTFAERFWAKVDKTAPLPNRRDDLGPCWRWTAARFKPANRGGEQRSYGVFGLERQTAHRVACELTVGTIPLGVFLIHLCENPACVRPEHLAPGGASRTRPERQVRGERHPGARLTEADVREIRRRRGAQSTLAREFGVTQALISRIKRRELWAHVEEAEVLALGPAASGETELR